MLAQIKEHVTGLDTFTITEVYLRFFTPHTAYMVNNVHVLSAVAGIPEDRDLRLSTPQMVLSKE